MIRSAKKMDRKSPFRLTASGSQGSQKGFTLLEVLIAIAIIAIGLISLAGMQTQALTGSVEAKDMTVAIQLAEEMVERIRLNGGDRVYSYNGLDTSNCENLSAPALGDCKKWKERLGSSTYGLPGAVGTVKVEDNSPVNNTATVTVTVTWGRIVQRSVTFTTIVETWLS